MEALVSLMILSILMTSIFATIRFSLVLTGDSIRKASDAQEEFNDLLLGDYDDDDTDITFTFSTINPEDPDTPYPYVDIKSTHPIYYYVDGKTIAFQPEN